MTKRPSNIIFTFRLQNELDQLQKDNEAISSEKIHTEKELDMLKDLTSNLDATLTELEEQQSQVSAQLALDQENYVTDSTVLNKQIKEMKQALEEAITLRYDLFDNCLKN